MTHDLDTTDDAPDTSTDDLSAPEAEAADIPEGDVSAAEAIDEAERLADHGDEASAAEVLAEAPASPEALDPISDEPIDVPDPAIEDRAAEEPGPTAEEPEPPARSKPVPAKEPEPAPAAPGDPFRGPGDWYVVHTYAGYENKVKTNLESRIHTMQMEEKIFRVHIPMEDVMEIKSGKKQIVQKKVFPDYLLVKMTYDNDS